MERVSVSYPDMIFQKKPVKIRKSSCRTCPQSLEELADVIWVDVTKIKQNVFEILFGNLCGPILGQRMWTIGQKNIWKVGKHSSIGLGFQRIFRLISKTMPVHIWKVFLDPSTWRQIGPLCCFVMPCYFWVICCLSKTRYAQCLHMTACYFRFLFLVCPCRGLNCLNWHYPWDLSVSI